MFSRSSLMFSTFKIFLNVFHVFDLHVYVHQNRVQYYVLLSESMSYNEAQKLKLSANVTRYYFPKSRFRQRKTYFASLALIDGAGYKSPTSDWIPLNTTELFER